MSITKPKQRAGKATRLLFALAVAVFAGTFLFLGGGESGGGVAEAIAGIAVLAIVGFIVFDADRRLRSVEIGPDGISALKWKRRPGWFPFHLMRVSMAWTEVTAVATRGLVVSLRGRSDAINVNTFLFEQPREVLALINSYLEDASRK